MPCLSFAFSVHNGETTRTRRTFANPTRFGVLERVPAPHLIDIVSEACGEWVERFFPDEPVAATVAQLS